MRQRSWPPRAARPALRASPGEALEGSTSASPTAPPAPSRPQGRPLPALLTRAPRARAWPWGGAGRRPGRLQPEARGLEPEPFSFTQDRTRQDTHLMDRGRVDLQHRTLLSQPQPALAISSASGFIWASAQAKKTTGRSDQLLACACERQLAAVRQPTAASAWTNPLTPTSSPPSSTASSGAGASSASPDSEKASS